MDFVVAAILYPLLVCVLAVGAGLLVDAASARALPGVLIPVVGLAALLVVAELFAYWEPIAPAAPAGVAVVAVVGYALGWRRLRWNALDPWPIAATAFTYVLVCLPVLLSGRVTLAGYLLDTTTAFHLAGADYLTAHARNFGRLPDSAMRGTLEGYFGRGYPSGGHTLLGATGRLTGVERMWLYQPYVSLLVAFCVPSLYYMARAVIASRAFAAGAAVIAATPALVYAYAQMGAIKELAALPFILLLGPLLLLLPRLLAVGLRGAIPFAVVAAAGIGAIGVAFGPWLLVIGLVGLVLVLVQSRRDIRLAKSLAAFAAVLAIATLVLAVPTFGPLSDSVSVAKSLSTSNQAAVNDPGNLLRPLLGSQVFGVWLGGSHRVDPPNRVDETFFLIAIVALSSLLGFVFLVRRRLWPLVGFAVALGVIWALLTYRGTEWTDAKLLVLSSPIVLLLAAFVAWSLIRAGRNIEGAILAAVIAFGVLASDAFTYHDTNLAPTARFQEMMEIGKRFTGTKPTLVPDFDEYAFSALPEMAPDAPGFAFRSEPLAKLRDGTLAAYAQTYDLDQIDPAAIQRYPLIMSRRKPEASRPPANFQLAFHGRFYDVWRRTPSPEVVEHLPAGGGLSATGRIGCRAAKSASARAKADGGSLRYVVRPPVEAIEAAKVSKRPAGWSVLPEGVGLYGPGTLEAPVKLPRSGRYRVWLKGDFARELTVRIDGRSIGGVSYQTGNQGNYAEPLIASLGEGRHVVSVERGGGSLRPGDGSPGRLVAIVFEPAGAAPVMREASPSDWRVVCRKPVDWLEVVRG